MTGDVGDDVEADFENFEEVELAEGDLEVDLGPCCACREVGKSVRNLLLLPLRLVGAEGGWGCVVCHLPPEGAVAVLCDRCLEDEREVVDVCAGYPALGGRVPRAGLTQPFEHDATFHPELWQERKIERRDA